MMPSREDMINVLVERNDKHTAWDKDHVRENLEKLDDKTIKTMFENLDLPQAQNNVEK